MDHLFDIMKISQIGGNQMKKVFSIMICMILSLSMSACDSKAKPLQSKESYTIGNQIEMQLKGIVIDQQVNPTNMNHEYQYWYTDEKGYRLVDVQFYVENHSDQTQELSDFYDAELQIDDNSVKQDVCMELEHYTKIEKETTLAANTKTILHQFFYLKEKDLKKDLTAVFTLDDVDYTLSLIHI